MIFESIYFRLYFTISHKCSPFFFTGTSGLTFTVGELPGSLASIGKFPIFFFPGEFSSLIFTFLKDFH